jgi:hypothetical protein
MNLLLTLIFIQQQTYFMGVKNGLGFKVFLHVNRHPGDERIFMLFYVKSGFLKKHAGSIRVTTFLRLAHKVSQL